MDPEKVLIVTGTLVSAKERSIKQFLKKQIDSFKASSGAWLDTQLKVIGAENITAQARYMKSRAFKQAKYHRTVSTVFGQDWNFGAPELTEVALMTLLAKEKIPYEAITYGELYGDEQLREKLLTECGCVFASTTLLRDLSELDPLMRILKRASNKVVVGGALTSILHHDFNGSPYIDVFTVGYGEMLVPSLANWIRGGYQRLEPPETGRVLQKGSTTLLYSGVPESKNLDFIDAPDWSLAEAYHQKKFEMVHYESVRGCPYRCSFCNYPFLFDDTKFRYKSAEKIVDDWEVYYKNGARYITCLDSLFTVPPKRLKRICELLIERQIKIKWICYARADDLTDLATCQLMRDAGCIQVQIGVESGSQEILDNMNKRCTVEQNALAIHNCRKVGITTLATVIIGFPGDHIGNLKKTLAFLKENPPDFYYSAPFNTRVEYIPILNEDNRKRFGILTNQGATSSAPYWKHNSMSSTELGSLIRWFNDQVMSEKMSLEGTLFYKIILNYDPGTREELLDYQFDVVKSYPGMRRFFKWVFDFTQRKLEADVTRVLGNFQPAVGADVPRIPIQSLR
ncbi:MAG TPA: radical SAM protein [Aquabacterium sp.]|nr:radical SAM protein [Aquabacterium sp.]